jgi:hypothetical protein
MRTIGIDTPHGTAVAHVHPVDRPRAAIVLGHGAGGGVGAPDLAAVTRPYSCRDEGRTIARCARHPDRVRAGPGAGAR